MALKPMSELGPQGQAKREQILKSARRLFLEQGFARTSMEAIREAAGVSKPTLYNHYANKEELFAGVIRDAVDEVAGEWLVAVANPAITLNTRADLRGLLVALGMRATTGLMRSDYLALVRLVITEMPRFPELGTIFRTIGPERGIRMLSQLIDRARTLGLVNFAHTELAARMVMGPILSYVMLDGLLAQGEPRVPEREQIELLIDSVMLAICPPEVA